jgi:hypothetical protein
VELEEHQLCGTNLYDWFDTSVRCFRPAAWIQIVYYYLLDRGDLSACLGLYVVDSRCLWNFFHPGNR